MDAQGDRLDHEKVHAISTLKEPNSVNELRRVLGLINYIGKYIPDLEIEGGTLYKLLKKRSVWTWDHLQ